jgi:hypothetical protein
LLSPAIYIEWPVPSQENERSCTSVMCYDFASFYNFFVGLWNSSNSVVLFPHFIMISLKYAITVLCYLLLCASIKLVICVQLQICTAIKWKILTFVHCRSLCRMVIRPLHLDYVKHGMILNTQQQMVKGLPTKGVESISYTDTKDTHIG